MLIEAALPLFITVIHSEALDATTRNLFFLFCSVQIIIAISLIKSLAWSVYGGLVLSVAYFVLVFTAGFKMVFLFWPLAEVIYAAVFFMTLFHILREHGILKEDNKNK